ncbi:MAG TPA: hypothetical protein DCY93_03885 [Firmicutes bacterium]|nr:hypothetical protein [Bacillota bacterium]
MNYFALYKVKYSSKRVDDITYLLQDDKDFFDNDWIRPIKFEEILAILTSCDRENGEIKITNDRVSYRNCLTGEKAFIFNADEICLLCEEKNNNYLRTLLLRLGHIIYLEPKASSLSLLV